MWYLIWILGLALATALAVLYTICHENVCTHGRE